MPNPSLLSSATFKRYALSSAITFSATFFTILGADFNSITNPSTLTFAVVVSLILGASRAAFKVVIESVVGGHADLPSITAPSNTAS